MQFTEQQVSIVARSLSDSAALVCQVDKDDNWKFYGENYIEEAKTALAALSAAAPQVVADEKTVANGAPQPIIGRLMDQISALPVLWGLNEPGALLRNSDVFRVLAAAGREQAALSAAPVPSNSPELHGIAAAPVQEDSYPNAPWLTLAHIICAGAGIPVGHISDRLEALRDKLDAPVQAQEPVIWYDAREGATDMGLLYESTRSLSIVGSSEGPFGHFTTPLYRAPVQPVAVPDGFEQVRFRFFKNLNADERKNVFKAFGVWPGDDREGKNIPHVWETLLLRSIFNIAAPAAQGDSKDTERLNFMDRMGFNNAGRYGGMFQVTWMDDILDRHITNGKDMRGALDAAIAAKAAS